MVRYFYILFAILTLSGCTHMQDVSARNTPMTQAELNGKYQLIAMTNAPRGIRYKADAIIRFSDWGAGFRLDCNSISVPGQVIQGVWALDPNPDMDGAATLMYCGGWKSKVDRRVEDMFRAPLSFARGPRGDLLVMGGGEKLRLRRVQEDRPS